LASRCHPWDREFAGKASIFHLFWVARVEADSDYRDVPCYRMVYGGFNNALIKPRDFTALLSGARAILTFPNTSGSQCFHWTNVQRVRGLGAVPVDRCGRACCQGRHA
jgi:hypothetical protein